MKISLSKELCEKITEEIYKNLKERLDGADEIDYEIEGISVTIKSAYYFKIAEKEE